MADGARLHPASSPGPPSRVPQQAEAGGRGRPFLEGQEKDGAVVNCTDVAGPGDITKD